MRDRKLLVGGVVGIVVATVATASIRWSPGAAARGLTGNSEVALVAPGPTAPTKDPDRAVYVSVQFHLKGVRVTAGAVTVHVGIARSYAVDPHDLLVSARNAAGKKIGDLWMSDPRVVRVYNTSKFREHAKKLAKADATVFLPLLRGLARVNVGYPGERATLIDLSPAIRRYCQEAPRKLTDCGAWLRVNR